ncbi:hypothetical protein PsYK624_141110 [Phanerochaete sordida]|uniref:F-box domain-containing protein n=1 Tax=Phanerochaete sordida TaxID=48140 RepID=A0A9P3GPC4_9APHY|nr:hypothetical protein PsYK624_141110 [Phanerochaete sordida]
MQTLYALWRASDPVTPPSLSVQLDHLCADSRSGREIPRLVPDIVNTVVDLLKDDSRSLKAIVGLARIWAPRSRYHLFRRLRMKPQQLNSLHELLDESMYAQGSLTPLNVLVEDLTLSHVRDWDTPERTSTVTAQALVQIVLRFPYLHSLKLERLHLPPADWSSYLDAFKKMALPSLADEFPAPPISLRSLTLSRTTADLRELLRFLSTFSHIETLTLHYLHLTEWSKKDTCGNRIGDLWRYIPTSGSLQANDALHNIIHVNVGTSDFLTDFPALEYLLMRAGLGTRLQSLNITLFNRLMSETPVVAPNEPRYKLNLAECRALQTLTLSNLVLTEDLEPFFRGIPEGVYIALARPPPATTTIELTVSYAARLSARETDFWETLQSYVLAWPALQTFRLRVLWAPQEGQEEALLEKLLRRRLERRLPVLRAQGALQIVLVRDEGPLACWNE